MNSKIVALSFIFLGLSYIGAQQLITPENAVSLALENNYGIKLTNNLIAVAENNTSIYNTGFLPTLTGNAGATFNLDNTEAEFSNGNRTNLENAESSRYNASLNLNYTLFDGLGRRYNYKRLKEEYQLSELQARETIENTIEQLFMVYYSVAQLSENASAIQESTKISKDRLVRAQYQFEYGVITKLGVLNAEVDINNDSINVINAYQQLKNTKRDLNLVLGNALKGDFNVSTAVNFELQLNKEALLEKTKMKNAQLLQIDKNILINEYNIKSGKSAYLPTLGLTGTYGWNENNNNAAAFVAVSTNVGLSGGLNLRWNLFDGGATLTRVKNAKVNLENQQLQKEQLLMTIERDFNNAWDDYQNKLAVFKIQAQNVKTAKHNFERTQEQFKIGQISSIDFRQAQLNLLNAELSRNQSKYQAKIAELGILRISGDLLNVEF